MTTKEELKPVYANVKSFYGKAFILRDETTVKLLSYDTIIVSIDLESRDVWVDEKYYSATTLRHLKEFLKQMGSHVESWKQIKQDYCSKNINVEVIKAKYR